MAMGSTGASNSKSQSKCPDILLEMSQKERRVGTYFEQLRFLNQNEADNPGTTPIRRILPGVCSRGKNWGGGNVPIFFLKKNPFLPLQMEGVGGPMSRKGTRGGGCRGRPPYLTPFSQNEMFQKLNTNFKKYRIL